MKLSFSNTVEQLNYELGILKRNSQEPSFGQYLCTVESRLIGAPNLAGDLRRELIHNYMIYADRMRQAGAIMPNTYLEMVYPGMEAPDVADQVSQAQTLVQPQQMAAQTQMLVQPQQMAQAQMPVQPQQMTQVQMPMQPQQMAQAKMPVQPQQMTAQVQMPVQPQQMPVQPNVQTVSGDKPENMATKNKAEFAIGGIVLSVLGTLLILSGFVMLAVNFFESFWQGMVLYGVCAALMAFSELLIKRFVPKLSYVFTSLALAGFFVVTLVNHFALGCFNIWIALIILIVLSVLTAVFSLVRKSFLFTVIGYVSSFVGLSLVATISNDVEVYVLFGTVLLLNLLWMAFPIKKYGRAFSIIQLVGNVYLLLMLLVWNAVIDYNEEMLFVRLLFIVVNLLGLIISMFLSGIRYYAETVDENGNTRLPNSIAYSILFGFAIFIYVMMISFTASDITYETYSLIASGAVVCVSIVPSIILMGLLRAKKCPLWQHTIYMMVILSLAGFYVSQNSLMIAIGCSVVIIAAEVSARVFKRTSLDVLDLLSKLFLIFMVIESANSDPYTIGTYVLIAATVASLAIGSGFLVPTQISFTGLLIYAINCLVPHDFWLIVASGIIMVTVFVFHNVKYLKSKYVLVFDIFALVGLVFILGFLNHPFYVKQYLPTIVVFTFGLATLLQYEQKKYKMFFAGNYLPVALYLSYFVLVLRIEEAIVTSGILMAVALVCVAIGFIVKQKSVRIYGLVLSMLVCAKLVFYDFFDATTLTKTIMYFVVGLIALAIAGVYIVVEMVLSKKAKQSNISGE